jgi:hypothetical protein
VEVNVPRRALPALAIALVCLTLAAAPLAATPVDDDHGRRVVNLRHRGKLVAQVAVDSHWQLGGRGQPTLTRGYARLTVLAPDGGVCVVSIASGAAQATASSADCRPRGRIERVNHGEVVEAGPDLLLATSSGPGATVGAGASTRLGSAWAERPAPCGVVVTAAYVDIRLRDGGLLNDVRVASHPAALPGRCID